MQHDAIAVVDFGGQYAHLIATKVRRHHVLAEILQPEDATARFERYKGVVLSGSPSLASQGEEAGYNKGIYDLDVPILGLCFGHQELAQHYGGRVRYGGREWGRATMHLVKPHPLFAGLEPMQQVWMSHFDSVDQLGPGFEELGYTTLGQEDAPHRFAAIGSDTHRRYGFQFHPEVDDTEHGDEMLRNFVVSICGCEPSWTMESYLEEQIAAIQARVAGESIFLLASGGVDSTVAARLLGMALGPERLHLLHVDNGLMRKDESRKVVEMYRSLGLGDHLHFVDATGDFVGPLAGVVEPEKKRAIIGEAFVRVFEQEAARLGIAGHLLGQGTIYPDTIETGGTKRADTIKTHHNRVPLIDDMIAAGRVIEPLADLYKVEVRELGERLGVPHEVLWRHPFPGPGLGVRLLCSDGYEDSEAVAKLAPQVAELGRTFQLDARVLPIRSVGVKADLRCYEHPVLFTGSAAWAELTDKAGALLKAVDGVNRCIWNAAPDRPESVELLAATITPERLALLREADAVVMDGLRRHRIYDRVWQCPTVLVPLRINGRGSELVILRPIQSERAMTAIAAELPSALIHEVAETIRAWPEVSGLGIDLTSKPPGTIEWE